jgi:hypothetical protein
MGLICCRHGLNEKSVQNLIISCHLAIESDNIKIDAKVMEQVRLRQLTLFHPGLTPTSKVS